MEDELIAAHGEVEKLMPYLHLPVQSGSDAVLDAMNRQHTADHYIRIIERIRAARPDIALSSDFIVGFRSEERRVGNECVRKRRSRWSAVSKKKKEIKNKKQK